MGYVAVMIAIVMPVMTMVTSVGRSSETRVGTCPPNTTPKIVFRGLTAFRGSFPVYIIIASTMGAKNIFSSVVLIICTILRYSGRLIMMLDMV